MPGPNPLSDSPDSGDPTGASSEMLPPLYQDLRKLAALKMAGESAGQTISATALVHEAYLRITDLDDAANWDSRGHFYAAAAEAMRRILIDRARSKMAVRNGGKWQRTELDSINTPVTTDRPDEFLALDEALARLEGEDERRARVVKLRFFIGLEVEEVAELLEISTATVKRDWAFARAWLHREVAGRLES